MRILLTITILSAALFGCLQQEQPPSPTPEITMPKADETPEPEIAIATPMPDLLTITTDKPSYHTGEDIEIRVIFENKGSESLTVEFPPPEINIIHWVTKKIVRSFIPNSQKIEVQPGERISYSLKWDQKDENGEQVCPGNYYMDTEVKVVGRLPSGYGTHYYHSESERILILYPRGAMEKTIEVNQSHTVNGITVVLQKMEFTESQAKIYALAKLPMPKPTPTPSSVPLPEPTPPDEMRPCDAYYIVDNGEEKDAGHVGIRVLGDGYRVKWIIDPIPSDAKEMRFVVLRFGKWVGPWEFHVTLN